MTRLFPYLGAVFALLIALLAANLMHIAVYTAPSTGAASSTLSVIPSLTPVPLRLGDLFPAPATTASSAPIAPKVSPAPLPKTATKPATPAAPAHVASAPAASSTTVAQPAPLPSSGNASLDAAATTLRSALVNIICEAPAGSSIRSISGSGIIVTSSGYVLTNAHVAQYFLLADKGVSCILRTGSPAKDTYRAALVYVPAAWISANATLITQAAPSGNGEHDYALLALTGMADGSALPTTFDALPLGTTPPSSGEGVVIGTYGAQFLTASQIANDLFPTLVFGSVKSVYTYGTDTVDVVALGGSAAAQEGSSGGGVADANGKLVATIVTSTVSGSTADRNVNAITASYIRADYASATGAPLDLLLAESPASAAHDFASRIPALEAYLTAALSGN